MDFSPFYKETSNFQNFSLEHLSSVFVVSLLGVVFIFLGKKKWSPDQKWRYAFYAAVVLYLLQLTKLFIRMYLGNVDYANDLPLHLCNFLPLLMAIGLYYRSRPLLSVIFFWILGGTFQANLTPTLENVLPHYEAIRYWFIHTGLPILAIYTYYVLGFRFTFKDVVRSALSLNIVAAVIYPINLMLDANYLYLNAKPPPGTIYDVLGPWPWYILSIEFLLLVFFGVALIPFLIYLYLNPNQREEIVVS